MNAGLLMVFDRFCMVFGGFRGYFKAETFKPSKETRGRCVVPFDARDCSSTVVRRSLQVALDEVLALMAQAKALSLMDELPLDSRFHSFFHAFGLFSSRFGAESGPKSPVSTDLGARWSGGCGGRSRGP